MSARQPARASSGRYVSRLTGGTLAIIMAGGRGERLRDLTAHRCKPATPFGGKFRIIDFVLSNCVNSGIRQISILTQYKAQSLIQHVQHGWSYLRGEFGEFIEVVPAQQQIGADWYRGTADAVYQNLELILAHRPKHVLVLAGDHIYKMDYGPMIAYHVEKGADITVGVVEVPASESRHYGVLTATEWNRVTKFSEKPAQPDTLPTRPDAILASMGIYVFNTELLAGMLAEDASNEASGHDFGKNILPDAIAAERQVFAYPFQDVKTRAQSYWRDVGTIDAFYDANLELVHVRPELNIYDEDWPIWTYQVQQPPAKFILDEEGRRGTAINSMVSGGCIISGAVVRESLLFSNVRVEERASIYRSVVLPNVAVGRGCVISDAIVDEGCEVPDGMRIGVDRGEDARRFFVTEEGVVLVTPDMLRGRRAGGR
jgi:glucose-1-phosphate adenylyltransferase